MGYASIADSFYTKEATGRVSKRCAMQMQLKVLKLELFYNSAATRMFQHDKYYLSPFPAETAEHFSRRLLAWLCLYELQPALAVQQAKGPDLYLLDQHQHYQLWCQVDAPNDKLLQKATHQSDQVLLMLDTQSLIRFLNNHRNQSNVQVCEIPDDTVAQCLSMLKAGMQWSVWRDEQQLQITDGEQMLELNTPKLAAGLH
jgi:uncharacterized protein YaeQ